MKQTLSLKKPLSFEQQEKITQKGGSVLDVNQQKESAEKEQIKKGIEWLIKTYPQCFDSKNPKERYKAGYLRRRFMVSLKNTTQKSSWVLCRFIFLL